MKSLIMLWMNLWRDIVQRLKLLSMSIIRLLSSTMVVEFQWESIRKREFPLQNWFYTKLHAGGKFNDERECLQSLWWIAWGRAAAVVNALSKWVKLEIKKDGKVYSLDFERGVVKEPLKVEGELEDPSISGTTVTFKPDDEIFENSRIQPRYAYQPLSRNGFS